MGRSASKVDRWSAHPAYWWALGIIALGSIAYYKRRPIMNLFNSPLEFATRLWAALGQITTSAGNKLGTATKLTILSHAAFESGWGKGTAAREGYNYFNITAGPQWKGPIILGADTEYDAAGNVKNITQKFRKYGSDQEAIRDYLDFLSTQNGGRYSKSYASLMAGNMTEFVAQLSAAGYYTLPVDQYQSQMAGAADSVKRLLT